MGNNWEIARKFLGNKWEITGKWEIIEKQLEITEKLCEPATILTCFSTCHLPT